MPDPLLTLLRLRRLAVDQARQGLADCLRDEAAAGQVVREIEAAVIRETDTACRLAGDDRTVEDFAVWLRRVRLELDAASETLLTAETRTQEARAVLSAGRTAVETVETLIARHEAELAAEERRKEQIELDEFARTHRRSEE
jgi:flagellar export protein FliJ